MRATQIAFLASALCFFIVCFLVFKIAKALYLQADYSEAVRIPVEEVVKFDLDYVRKSTILDVEYSYVVNGSRYISNKVGLAGNEIRGLQDRSLVKKLKNFSEQKIELYCFVRNENPEDAVLENTLKKSSVVLYFAAILVSAFLLYKAIIAYQYERSIIREQISL